MLLAQDALTLVIPAADCACVPLAAKANRTAGIAHFRPTVIFALYSTRQAISLATTPSMTLRIIFEFIYIFKCTNVHGLPGMRNDHLSCLRLAAPARLRTSSRCA
jgi:hypothetical protein